MPLARMILTEITKAPTSFETTWSIVNLLRRVRDAPVDLWGCDKVVDTKAEKGIFEFQTVVAAMLSSQTKDRYVKEAMDNLIAHDLSLAGVLAQTEDEIDAHIKMVGFHRTKAKNILLVARLIGTEHGGCVPSDFDALIKLPGVGPKMANMIICCAFNQSSGIIVDTHVHRICTALGWGCRSCKTLCKQPEHTRRVLEQWVPKPMWREFTYLLVGLGQQSQGSRKLLMSRCLALDNCLEGLRFLKKIGMNMRNLDLMGAAIELGHGEDVLQFLKGLS